MKTANALRIEIERALTNRFPSALTPARRLEPDRADIGIPQIDALLGGGFPVGAISEITGPASSGRTGIAWSFIAKRTSAGQVCAWVDVSNALDPESAAATGVELKRLLWIRCRTEAQPTNSKPWSHLDQALKATDLLLQAGGFAAIVLDLGDVSPMQARRIPLATWYRYKLAADQSRSSLLVLGKSTYAQASAAVVVECSPGRGGAWQPCPA